MMVLSEIGVNIGPLLAGAGIVGVAIGFGSQKLVQDLINGIFLLLENAMQVGDQVTVSGLSGTVENLSVRTIRLRAGDGSVHIIPFSSVTSVTNVNRGIGNASVNVCVAFHEDTDRVCEVLKETAAGMRKETDFSAKMLSDLQLLGCGQGGRRRRDHCWPSGLHRFRPLERAARIQSADEEAVRGTGHRNLQPDATHGRLDADADRRRCERIGATRPQEAGDMTTAAGLDSARGIAAVDGFAFVHGAEMRALFAAHGSLADWPAFAASWDDLGLDTYMADGGRYRKRRHATFARGWRRADPSRAAPAALSKPRLQCAERRHRALVRSGAARRSRAGATLTTILETCRDAVRATCDDTGAGMSRYTSSASRRAAGVEGRPTPEGMHRDGVDYVLVLLIGRRNIQSGVTSIHDASGRDLGSFTLAEPFDAAWVDDHRMMHGVTPVEPIDPVGPGSAMCWW